MEKRYLFVANWKMRFHLDEALHFASSNYDDLVELANTSDRTIVLCSDFVALYPLVKMFKGTNVAVGAQDCSKHINGPFTGHVPATSLHKVGCSYCIVGHSERRKHNGETSPIISQKMSHLLDYDVSPIVCIGETKEEYEQKQTLDVLEEQLAPILELLEKRAAISKYTSISIAYEPIWSIGTGNIPTLEHLNTIFAWINEKVHGVSENITWSFLYGGSVDGNNVAYLKQVEHCNGFLMGKSGTDFQEFKNVVDLVALK